jgi:hypothetical protein
MTVATPFRGLYPYNLSFILLVFESPWGMDVLTFLSFCVVVCACMLGLLEPEYEGTALLMNIDVTQLTRHRQFNFHFLNN